MVIRLISLMLLIVTITRAFLSPKSGPVIPRSFLARMMRTSATSVSSSSSVTEQMRLVADREMNKIIQHYQQEKSPFAPPLLWTRPDQVSDFVDSKGIDSFLFDCDGVVYRSPDPAPGAIACIKSLLAKDMKVFFVTNNAGTNRAQLREKLTKILQIDGLTNDMMISSSYSASQYLKKEILSRKQEGTGRLHVIGSAGLCEELRQTGFDVTTTDADKPSMSRDELASYDFSELHPVDAVVVGHDTAVNFRKLCIANVLLQMNPDAPLVATNDDAFDIVGADARHIVGNGATVHALEHSSRRKAINAGKPSRLLADLIYSTYNVDPTRSIIIGDRLDTDIRFGVESGMYSVLVMTGVTTAEKLIQLGTDGTQEEPLPTAIMPYVELMA